MSTEKTPVARWLESREGEEWSRNNHRAAHAGESHLPNHIASVRPTPGRDPVWDRPPRDFPGVRDPRQDPSGRPPLARTASRAEDELLRARVSTKAAAVNAREGLASIPARTPKARPARTTRTRSPR